MQRLGLERGLWAAVATSVAVGLSSLATGVGCDDGNVGAGGTGGGAGGTDPCAAELPTDENGCFEYDCFVQLEEPVSFRTDVLPIFEQSCSLSASCHGNPTSPETADGYQPYLGEVDPEVTPSDIDLIFATIVGQDSHDATMRIVAIGDPERSFLMHKMDGDLECPDLQCTDGDCGDSMPQGSSTLPRATRDIVRTWIAQGAMNN